MFFGKKRDPLAGAAPATNGAAAPATNGLTHPADFAAIFNKQAAPAPPATAPAPDFASLFKTPPPAQAPAMAPAQAPALAPAASAQPPAPQPAASAKLTPEMAAQIADARNRVHAAVGQVVMALAAIPRYRHQSIGDLQSLVFEPLLRDRIAIASSTAASNTNEPPGALAGIAFWATVSPEVDAKIRDQIKSGTFPVQLKPEEWTSGGQVWLLDVVAPSQKMASAVLANFKQVLAQTGMNGLNPNAEVRIHPMVGRQVDPELLRKMGAVAG